MKIWPQWIYSVRLHFAVHWQYRVSWRDEITMTRIHSSLLHRNLRRKSLKCNNYLSVTTVLVQRNKESSSLDFGSKQAYLIHMFKRHASDQKRTNSLPHRTFTSKLRESVRRQSAPPEYSGRHRPKGIIKYATVDESLHSGYGSESNDQDIHLKRSVSFSEIQIREYNRTLGDNPSCSSGPPIS
jgi:hypothetical protein